MVCGLEQGEMIINPSLRARSTVRRGRDGIQPFLSQQDDTRKKREKRNKAWQTQRMYILLADDKSTTIPPQ